MSTSQKDILNLFRRPFDATEKPSVVFDSKVHTETTFSFHSETLSGGSSGTPFSGHGVPPTVVSSGTPYSGHGFLPSEEEKALDIALRIPQSVPFSIFIDFHRNAARALIEYFMKAESESEFVKMAKKYQNKLNAELFIYATSSVLMRKPEFRHIPVPSIVEVFPHRFVETTKLVTATKAVNEMKPGEEVPVVNVDEEFSGTSLKPEHRVSIWREDYGISSHHHHWHLVYSFDQKPDRKGELFYYMHQQMLARYDMERLSVGLNQVLPLNDLNAPIPEGYFPKLDVNNSGHKFGSRQDFTILRNVRRPGNKVDISDIETWRGRILDAIHQRYLLDKGGNRIDLTDDDLVNGKRGIDILGDTIEADDSLSPNLCFYGSIHNMGHNLLAWAHDPEDYHKECSGVMNGPETAMRDPVFYRWHKFIDSLFQEYKLAQRPYTQKDLKLKGVKVDCVEVQHENGEKNILNTRWGEKEVDGKGGLLFDGDKTVRFKFRCLDHQPFNYTIKVSNFLSQPKEVTVRIFLAPKRDERRQELCYSNQRLLWAEMDKFTYELQPGNNVLSRKSIDSSVTCPEDMTMKKCQEIVSGNQAVEKNPYCSCGWPQHLLLPRGTPKGMEFQLFVMLTDWNRDKVEQPSSCKKCKNAASFCGLQDAKYPDSRPMGFPFDRSLPSDIPTSNEAGIITTCDFAEAFENIMLTDIKIIFDDSRPNQTQKEPMD